MARHKLWSKGIGFDSINNFMTNGLFMTNDFIRFFKQDYKNN